MPPPCPHSDSEPDHALACLLPLVPREREVPASSVTATFPDLPGNPLPGVFSPPFDPSANALKPPSTPLDEGGTIPLHHPTAPASMPTLDVLTAIHKLLTCIDICMVMMLMYITSTDARAGVLSHRKKLRNGLEENVDDRANITYTRRDNEEEELEHPHVKQNLDLLAWHVWMLDARWYVKVRSTCCFEQYLFNIYTPDIFYDILRMRRRIFNMLVHDLRPYI